MYLDQYLPSSWLLNFLSSTPQLNFTYFVFVVFLPIRFLLFCSSWEPRFSSRNPHPYNCSSRDSFLQHPLWPPQASAHVWLVDRNTSIHTDKKENKSLQGLKQMRPLLFLCWEGGMDAPRWESWQDLQIVLSAARGTQQGRVMQKAAYLWIQYLKMEFLFKK